MATGSMGTNGAVAGRTASAAPLEPEALVPDAVAEMTVPDCPGERVCLSPRLRQERARNGRTCCRPKRRRWRCKIRSRA